MWKSFIDYSNWFGPTATWLETCNFGSAPDFQLWAYNPWDKAVVNSGDVTFLTMPKSFFDIGLDYNGTAIPIVTPAVPGPPLVPAVHEPRYRPIATSPNFYRDCYILDDAYVTTADNFHTIFVVSFIARLFDLDISSFIKDVVEDV